MEPDNNQNYWQNPKTPEKGSTNYSQSRLYDPISRDVQNIAMAILSTLYQLSHGFNDSYSIHTFSLIILKMCISNLQDT